jgi:polysaccharide export outer membrane protein
MAAPPSGVPTPSPTAAAPIEYAVGPDDIVKVAVVGHDDLAPTLLVQADGTFIFPLVGRVRVADLTPSEIEKKIAGLLAQGFIRNPQVTVTVQEYRSKSVMVLGEVSRPGPYPLSGSLRVVEVLAKAGLLPSAGHEIQVVRPLSATDRPILPAEVAGAPGAELTASKQAEIFKVDLRAVQLGDLDKNMALRPNDTVFVPPAAKFYVTGEARNPGAYTLSPGITVREAVILAGGFTDNAAAGRTRVIREVEGQKREIKVKLEDAVQPGDIIVVKGKLF